jgi:hypothetical protein
MQGNNSTPIFDGWHSFPEPGAVERDLTSATKVMDMENTNGEIFHWEVPPGDTRDVPTRSNGDKTLALLITKPFYHPSVNIIERKIGEHKPSRNG